MDDKYVVSVGELQEIIYQLDEENLEESVNKINKLEIKSCDFARNIIRLSRFHRKKIPLFVRLVLLLKDKIEILDQIESFVSFGVLVKAQPFLIKLVDENLIKSSLRSKLMQEKEFLQDIIEEDDVDELIRVSASPDFDFNQKFKIPLTHWSNEMTLIQFSALSGSIKCFRFLYINNAELHDNRNDLMNLAISGGNVEIIQILEQEGIHPDDSSIYYSIYFHRYDIFDWLFDYFEDPIDTYNPQRSFEILCLKEEFIHGFSKAECTELDEAFAASCLGGLVNKQLLNHPLLDVNAFCSSLINQKDFFKL